MRLLYNLLIGLVSIQFLYGKILHSCRFVRMFYENYPNIFELDSERTSLTVRPLYALTNQSFSTPSIGMIYRLADTYLVPVPLLFQCPQTKRIVTRIDCEFTIVGDRANFSLRTTEPTRTVTVPLHFQQYSTSKSMLTRGAYFKQSTIVIQNCRSNTKENLFTSETFQLHIEFEQTINSSCQNTCIHPQLYECSALSNTCQCRSNGNGIEKLGHLCVDTELGSNCSLTPERCRRLCRISDQLHTGRINPDCQCPLGLQRILSNNIYHCDFSISECNHNNRPLVTCPKGYTCRQKRCVQVATFVRLNRSILSLPLMLIVLLIGAVFIIIILSIGLIRMRSIRCIKFVHPHILSIDSNTSSSTTITRYKLCDKLTKLNF